jgi:hypothetical protein
LRRQGGATPSEHRVLGVVNAAEEGNYIKGVTVIAAPVGAGPERVSHVVVAVGLSSTTSRRGLRQLGSQGSG